VQLSDIVFLVAVLLLICQNWDFAGVTLPALLVVIALILSSSLITHVLRLQVFIVAREDLQTFDVNKVAALYLLIMHWFVTCWWSLLMICY
jgi:hypothetical protein